MHIREQTLFPLPVAKKSTLLNHIIILWLSNRSAIVSLHSSWHWLLNPQHKFFARLVWSASPKWEASLTSLTLSDLMRREREREQEKLILWGRAFSNSWCLSELPDISCKCLTISAVFWKILDFVFAICFGWQCYWRGMNSCHYLV